jgi:signal transduction histidine kinase
MTRTQIDSVFKPLCQAEAYTTRKYGGTGLGLTISKHLVEALDGMIRVASEPEKGSTFTVTVGAGSLEGVSLLHDLTEATLEARLANGDPSSNCETLSCRVLLVEDGPDNR